LKNKTATYVLLVAAAAVWGIIVYRIIQTVKGGEEQVQTEIQWNNNIQKAEIPDTFSIALDYYDPFFNKVSASNMYSAYNLKNDRSPGRAVSPARTNTANSNKNNSTIDWSFISFNGMIKNTSTKSHVALLTIHQKGHMFKVGETYDNVKLLKATKDSVVILYQKEKKTIKRK
jgi:hypothetical protein